MAVELLKHLGRGDWSLERIRAIAKGWSSWIRNGAAVEAVCRELGAEIDRLSHRVTRASRKSPCPIVSRVRSFERNPRLS
jgi:hypothetical protein